MDVKIKSPTLAGDSGFQIPLQLDNTQSTRKQRKWVRVLRALLTGRSYHRFQAERELHDHCLHSTVARLQSMGLTIHRQDIVVSGFEGSRTHVMQYQLALGSRAKAAELLGIIDSGGNAAGCSNG